ncbi:hypothetical protein EYF80_066469 [Liparis tanakae]|uniref:Uncharacterized protein n=1 Tax=Liparis tanakae TaxID=230148 RepID=A0A4Z2E3W2_9TELE|nr:hypothetical protein EYF80_066469 [Liparis tanakae]
MNAFPPAAGIIIHDEFASNQANAPGALDNPRRDIDRDDLMAAGGQTFRGRTAASFLAEETESGAGKKKGEKKKSH